MPTMCLPELVPQPTCHVRHHAAASWPNISEHTHLITGRNIGTQYNMQVSCPKDVSCNIVGIGILVRKRL